MLQQTQTERVLPKYLAFLASLPGPSDLAEASVAEVLGLWTGLGYNRRALALRASAAEIVSRHGGLVPDDEEELLALPGVGPYTARAIQAFAFDRPVTLIETNVRSAFLHRFFPGEVGVLDASIEPLVAAALDKADPRNWYYALMDFGVMIKRLHGNPNRRSAHYARQSPFADSNRRLRGQILKALGAGGLHPDELAARIPFARERLEAALGELVAEGFLEYRGTGAELGLRGARPAT